MQGLSFAIHHAKAGKPDFIIPLTFDITKEEEKWVGVCLELGTSTFADSLEGVKEELMEAISLQLNETEKLGFIWDYLREHNVRIVDFPSLSRKDLPGFSITDVR